MSIKLFTKTTTADVADLVEYSLNEAEPKIKTRRGTGGSIELRVGRRKFIVSVARPARRKTGNRKPEAGGED